MPNIELYYCWKNIEIILYFIIKLCMFILFSLVNFIFYKASFYKEFYIFLVKYLESFKCF